MEISMEKAYKLEFGGQPGGELFMTCCGCSRTEPLHCFGPAMKPHYLIHYVLNGRGIFQNGGRGISAGSRLRILIEPGQMSFYQADEKDPWMYIWVGFAGERAEEYVKSMGISPRTRCFIPEQSDELYSIVRDMMDHNTVGVANELRRNGLLHIFSVGCGAEYAGGKAGGNGSGEPVCPPGSGIYSA